MTTEAEAIMRRFILVSSMTVIRRNIATSLGTSPDIQVLAKGGPKGTPRRASRSGDAWKPPVEHYDDWRRPEGVRRRHADEKAGPVRCHVVGDGAAMKRSTR